MSDSTSQLTIGISYSYIHYIDEYLMLLNNTLYSSALYLDEETAGIIAEMENIFLSLPTLLSKDSTSRESYASEIIKFRKIIEGKYRVLNAYQRELHHLITGLNFSPNDSDLSLGSMQLMEDELLSIDLDQLVSDCANFVFEPSDPGTKQERAALLLPYIPIKITKENYLYYVKKSIAHIALQDTPENTALLLSVLLQLFDGHLCPGYGEHFKDIALTLVDLNLTKHSEDFFEDAELLGETIGTLLKMLSNLYKMAGALANLFIFDALDFEAVTTLHMSFYDLYHALKNILTSGEDKDLFLSTIPDKVEEIKNDLQLSYAKIHTLKQIDPLFLLIHSYLSIDAGHIFRFDLQTRGNSTFETPATVENFLLALKDRLLDLPTVDRKLRMQYFISTIPFVMSHENFYSYTKQAFSNTSNPAQSLAAVMYLSHLLEENNASEYADSPYTTEPLNHHDCDCKDHKH